MPLQWKRAVFSPGPPGESPSAVFKPGFLGSALGPGRSPVPPGFGYHWGSHPLVGLGAGRGGFHVCPKAALRPLPPASLTLRPDCRPRRALLGSSTSGCSAVSFLSRDRSWGPGWHCAISPLGTAAVLPLLEKGPWAPARQGSGVSPEQRSFWTSPSLHGAPAPQTQGLLACSVWGGAHTLSTQPWGLHCTRLPAGPHSGVTSVLGEPRGP